MIQKILKHCIQFIISFSVTLYVVTFVLRVPHTLTNSPSIVDEYYIQNFTTNVPLDFFFVFVYLQISLLFIRLFRINQYTEKVFIVALTTAFLTGGFCFYFLQIPPTKRFFSRWFHKVGYISVIYDVILLVGTYMLMQHLDYLIPQNA